MTKTASRAPDLLHGPVFSNMTRFFLPIMLGSLLQQLYSMVDAVVLGRLVGKTALAAVGGSDLVIINLVVGFFVGLSSGACVVVSQHYGAGERDMVRKSVHTAILFSVVIGAVMTALGIGMARPVLVLLDPPADTLADSIVYLQWYFAGMIPSMVYNMGAGILRAVGDSKRPLYFLIVCALANTGLDLLFVAVFGLGTAGAAMATSLSQLICAGLVIWVLLRIPGDCRLHLSELRFDGALLRRMTAIGLPAGLATIMYSVANVIIQKAINLLGTDTAAAWSIYWKLDGFYWPISNAIGITVMTFAGQNFGARQLGRIYSVIHTGLWMHAGFSALFSVLMFLTRGLTVRFFTDDGNVMAEGQPDHHHAGVFLSDVLLRGGLVLRHARLRAERHADGPDAVRHLPAAAGAAVFRDIPALEQLDHCAVLSRNVADHVRAVRNLLQVLPLDAGDEAGLIYE